LSRQHKQDFLGTGRHGRRVSAHDLPRHRNPPPATGHVDTFTCGPYARRCPQERCVKCTSVRCRVRNHRAARAVRRHIDLTQERRLRRIATKRRLVICSVTAVPLARQLLKVGQAICIIATGRLGVGHTIEPLCGGEHCPGDDDPGHDLHHEVAALTTLLAYARKWFYMHCEAFPRSVDAPTTTYC